MVAMNGRMAVAAALAIVVVGVAVFFVQRAAFSGSSDGGPEPQRYGEEALIGVPQDEPPGVHFSAPPSDYKPKISSGEAFRIARDWRHIDARQILLASVQQDVPQKRTQGWIVNFDPRHAGAYGVCATSIIYSVEVVDAEDGHILAGETTTAPSPQCRYPADIPGKIKTPDTPSPPGISPEP